MPSQRVAVIGAGCSGLAALRSLLAHPQTFEVTVFEKSPHVGGIWKYDGVGPMYRDLRTNLPKPVMSFADFPFKGTTSRSFPTHQEVLQYINDFLDDTNGRHLVKFNTEVLHVRPVSGRGDRTQWLLRSSSEGVVKEEFFHAVFVCNGHFEVPMVPEIEGLEDFSGQVFHSKDYDAPEDFAGKKVLVLGARSSGLDITIGVAPFAKEIIVSHHMVDFPKGLPSNSRAVASIESFKNGGFCLADGSRVTDVDVLVFCTGYQYSFPFLHPDCGITVSDGHCRPLWRHFVNAHHPSMFFLGIPLIVTPLPQLTHQAAVAVAFLEGRIALPSLAEMLSEIEEDFQRRIVATNDKPSHFHVMADRQWDYNDALADLVGLPRLPRSVRAIYDDVWMKRKSGELQTYRLYNYHTHSNGDDFEMEKIQE